MQLLIMQPSPTSCYILSYFLVIYIYNYVDNYLDIAKDEEMTGGKNALYLEGKKLYKYCIIFFRLASGGNNFLEKK
jgi:hypothetical protein